MGWESVFNVFSGIVANLLSNIRRQEDSSREEEYRERAFHQEMKREIDELEKLKLDMEFKMEKMKYEMEMETLRANSELGLARLALEEERTRFEIEKLRYEAQKARDRAESERQRGNHEQDPWKRNEAKTNACESDREAEEREDQVKVMLHLLQASSSVSEAAESGDIIRLQETLNSLTPFRKS